MQRLSLTDSTSEDWNYDSNENAFSIFYNKEYGLKWYKFKNSISDGGKVNFHDWCCTYQRWIAHVSSL